MARQPQDPDSLDDFADFMRAYQDMVFSTAVRIVGNDTHAEEIAQEVFLKAYQQYEQLRHSPAVGGWLKVVARRMSLNHVHRYKNRWRFFSDLKRHTEDEDDSELDIPVPDNVVAELDDEERAAIVEQALQKLPDHQRVPLVLFHFEDVPYEEIAAQLHVSLAKVKTDILRGRRALAQILARRGIAADQLEA